MSAKPTNTLQGFCDADWGTCINSRRSITGYMIMFGNSFISWKSKKLPADPRSLTEAEYRSLASTVAEVALDISQVNAQHRCTKILNPKGCVLSDCKKECFQKYNENGLCSSGGTIGQYVCTCV
uniref:Uncharacterized protein n=1 Tax=Solanum lycopersicum TaxID=4081 RepID=A0A3Q7IIE1_SOLLC